MHSPTVFIIGGGGMVGATAAQALATKEIVHDIALIDVAEDIAKAQAMDITHASAYTSGVQVRVDDYSQITEQDIVIITSGASMAGQGANNRMELLATNVKIIRDVVGKIMQQGKAPAFIVMVTNPVDVLTKVALEVSGLPKERVFGTGTVIDTARMQVTLGNLLHVQPQQIEALVLGEHGDSSFPALSHATVGGVPLDKFPGFSPDMTATIHTDIRNTAYKIVQAKRSTNFSIGHVIAKIVEALLSNKGTILPVCSLATGEYGLRDVVVGLPNLVSNKGVLIVDGYPLTGEETDKLQASAQVIKEAIDEAIQ